MEPFLSLLDNGMLEQFHTYDYSSQLVVVLTNTVFNNVESILVAPVKTMEKRVLIKNLQIPCIVNDENHFIDLLDIATVSQRKLKNTPVVNLVESRQQIKYGLDLLIDGF